MNESPIQRNNDSTIKRSVMFVAGEPSGDQNAAGVCDALRRLSPDLRIWGAAGPKLHAAGCERVVDLTKLAVVGLIEVARNYFKFKRIFDQLLAEVEKRKPTAVVLTDFAGFNLRFAEALRARGYRGKIIYFVSPQVWASRPERAEALAQCCDLMLCLFPFEQDWYAQRTPSFRVVCVGHPLVERLSPLQLKTVRREKLIALLPGSRKNEVSKLWHPLVQAAEIIRKVEPQVQFVAAAASAELARELKAPTIRVVVGDTAKVLQEAQVAIVASGTATVECAFFGCPMVVVYRVAWPTYFAGRALIQVPHIAMPNILAGRQIVPELVQDKASPQAIASATLELLQQSDKRNQQRLDLAEVVKKLGSSGASERAAKAILSELSS